MNRKWRLYLDTSVFGGCFDMVEGWAEDSRRVMDAAYAIVSPKEVRFDE